MATKTKKPRPRAGAKRRTENGIERAARRAGIKPRTHLPIVPIDGEKLVNWSSILNGAQHEIIAAPSRGHETTGGGGAQAALRAYDAIEWVRRELGAALQSQVRGAS